MARIKENINERSAKYLDGAKEKGASAWLSCLPLKNMGYSLNKQDFQDALCLRYGWPISGVPFHCACGSKNDIDHCLTCKKGGYVNMRHNIIRDTEASIMKDVAYDVHTEPGLLPVGNTQLKNGTNIAEMARLDVSARGIWNHCEKTMFDVRITHHLAPSNSRKTIDELLHSQEQEKIKMYGDRILQVENASFIPLVYTTSGAMGPQCKKLHCQLANLICRKTNEKYSIVMAHLRTRLRFALLKSTIVALRGYRGTGQTKSDVTPLSEVDFGMVDVLKDVI